MEDSKELPQVYIIGSSQNHTKLKSELFLYVNFFLHM